MPWSPLPTPDGPEDRPVPLREALGRVRESLGTPPVGTLERIRADWDDLVGPEAARALRPVALEGRRLVLRTASPAWASQVRWLAPALLSGIAERCEDGVVNAVVVRTDRPARKG